MAKIYVSSLGCKLNQAEVEDYGRRLERDGHQFVRSLEEAEVHLINSCTVTHLAARDSRKTLRRGQRLRPEVRTVLTGCWAASDEEEARALVGDGLIVPNPEKDALVERLYATWPDLAPVGEPVPLPPATASSEVPVSYVPLPFGNVRGAIKVEDGCNMTCAFCIIPSTRGRQRSLGVDDVIAEFAGLARRGVGEIVVTGVQISSYRDGGRRLYDLVRRLLEQDLPPRLRLSSIAPWQFDRRLLELWSDPRLCRHLHLSLQSGDDAVLRRMRRPYTTAAYSDLLVELRECVPRLAITTDVIVGFPGESEAEFARSLDYVAASGFARVHVFPYSERPGTRSADLHDDVPPPVKKDRVERMRAVADQSARRFVERRVGASMRVLWEREDRGRVEGTSDDYVRCSVPRDQATARGTVQTVHGASRRGRVLECVVGSSAASRRLPVV